MSSNLNIKILRDARTARKLSIDEVAEFANISPGRLKKFEAADAEPSVNQLVKLGELYNLAYYRFFEEAPVEFDEPLPDFRKARPSAANLSPKGLVRIWQIGAQAKFVSELVDALGREAPERSSFKRLTNNTRPSSENLRSSFDQWREKITPKLKVYGDEEDRFTSHLRTFVEFHGCATSFNSAPSSDYLGFFKEFSDTTNTVFVNRDQSHQKRKLFTFCHEVAHYLYDAEGVSNPFLANNDVEKTCNRYAAGFLAPEDMVLKLLRQHASVTDPQAMIDLVSRYSLLSRQASALRLADLDIIRKSDLSAFFRKVLSSTKFREVDKAEKKKGAMGRAAAVGKRLSEVGLYNSYVAGIAVQKKLVDKFDVERGLGISEGLQGDVFDLAARRYEANF